MKLICLKKVFFGLATLQLAMASTFAATSDCNKPTEITLNGTVTMKFCEIPAGKASIGSHRGEFNEKPVFERTFKSFQIGQFTVTQSQYKELLGEEPWKKDGKLQPFVQEGDNYPAVYVSYVQARQFAQAMNIIDSSAHYRLPTEAEFEYAARAGTITHYYWGDEIDSNYTYYYENTKNGGKHARDVTTCPVAMLDKKHPGYCANSYGLMHMLGNVMQWTADIQGSYEYAPTDGNVASTGGPRAEGYHVIRGGSWEHFDDNLRSSRRRAIYGDSFHSLGFRVARVPK